MSSKQDRAAGATQPAALILVTGLFFLWGVANNLNDVLIAHFRTLFALGDFQAGLVQSAFYLGYFCFALPASAVMQRRGYKQAVVLGLLLFGVGALLFWPASLMLSHPFFLLALFVIASGLAFLETAANPMVAALGPPQSAERRLNFAQAFNPLGSITGVAIGASFILSDGTVDRARAAAAVRLPYLAIALVVFGWALLIGRVRLPAAATAAEEEGPSLGPALHALIRRPRYLAGVAAQFFYVGAQVGVWSFLIRYAAVALPSLGTQAAAWLLTGSLILFMLGRFAGAALMARVPGARLMLGYAIADMILCAIAALFSGWLGVGALILTSGFMSIMYPTIFVLSLRGLGPYTKPAAALIVMAIVGGAFMPALMGLVSDLTGTIRIAMAVPAGCFLVVALFAASHRHAEARP